MPLVIIIAVLGTALDQISKILIAQNITLNQSVTIIDNVLFLHILIIPEWRSDCLKGPSGFLFPLRC